MLTATALLAWGSLIHLVCDWVLQNDWMARNKVNPAHPASYVHAGIHTLGLALIYPAWAALAIGAIHWFIDLRFALAAWRHAFGQDSGPVAVHVAIWEDQAVHLAVLGVFALACGVR
jgi:hypothetical protein